VTDKKRYKIGDQVWQPRYENVKLEKTCPMCFGKKQVVLILGDDSQCVTECNYCGLGFNGSRGFVEDWEFIVDARPMAITNVRIVESVDGDKIEYMSDCYYLDPYDTKEEALEVAQKMADIEKERREKCSFNSKEDKKKALSWNAGYHVRCANDAKRKLEYHEARAKIFKDKIKEKKIANV
jgi:hypothetical protein